jgi:hypothetical protein
VHYLHFIAIADLPLPTGWASLNNDNLKHRSRKNHPAANIPLRLIKHAKIKAQACFAVPVKHFQPDRYKYSVQAA